MAINQFHRGNQLVTIPPTSSYYWLKRQITYAKNSAARAKNPDAVIEYLEYADALEGALKLKRTMCPTRERSKYE